MIEIKAENEGAIQLAKMLGVTVSKQIPFAKVLGVTRTAQRVKAGEIDVMQARFDRPTPFTINSLMLRPATKARPEARVWFRDFAPKGTPAQRYLGPQAFGGARSQKRMERALIRFGLMDADEFAVPASGAELDPFGNVNRGQVVRILSALQAFGQQGYTANRSASRRSQRKSAKNDYFVGTIEGTRGIWLRRGTAWGAAVKPIYTFTKGSPQYRVRVPFQKIAENIIKARYETEFMGALQEAIKTARR